MRIRIAIAATAVLALGVGGTVLAEDELTPGWVADVRDSGGPPAFVDDVRSDGGPPAWVDTHAGSDADTDADTETASDADEATATDVDAADQGGAEVEQATNELPEQANVPAWVADVKANGGPPAWVADVKTNGGPPAFVETQRSARAKGQ